MIMRPLLLLVAVLGLHCHSSLLEKMAQALDIADTIEAMEDGFHYRSLKWSGYPLNVYKCGGEVRHIGFSMFSAEEMQAYPRPVAEFIERYPLELMLELDKERSMAVRMFEDGVDFQKGSLNAMLDSFCPDITAVSSSLENIMGRRYCFRWEGGSAGAGMLVFPIDWQLISGRTMIENEDALPSEIMAAGALPLPELPKLDSGHVKDSIIVLDGGFCYLEELSSARYYEAGSGEGVSLMSNPDSLKEYTANLFTGGGIDNSFTLNVKLRMYGLKSSYFKVGLDKWLSFCFESGCVPYWGMDSSDGGIITGELVMHNEACGYDHVMRIWAPLDALRSGEGELQCRLIPYIPLHSLRYLFEETKS